MARHPDKFKHIDAKAITRDLAKPLGYKEPSVQVPHQKYFVNYSDEKNIPGTEFYEGREEMLTLIENLLWAGAVALERGHSETELNDPGKEEIDYSQRLPIKEVGIHHTATGSDISKKRLNAHGYLEADLYLGHFTKFRSDRAIFSGHPYKIDERFGKRTIESTFTYHLIIRPDGSYERLIPTANVAWALGSWERNTLAVNIAFAGTYTDSSPSQKALRTCAVILETEFAGARVYGHNDIINTICPGNTFKNGWGEQLQPGSPLRKSVRPRN